MKEGEDWRAQRSKSFVLLMVLEWNLTVSDMKEFRPLSDATSAFMHCGVIKNQFYCQVYRVSKGSSKQLTAALGWQRHNTARAASAAAGVWGSVLHSLSVMGNGVAIYQLSEGQMWPLILFCAATRYHACTYYSYFYYQQDFNFKGILSFSHGLRYCWAWYYTGTEHNSSSCPNGFLSRWKIRDNRWIDGEHEETEAVLISTGSSNISTL